MKNDKIKTLTRSDLADAITDEFRVTRFIASEIVEDVLDEISSALMNGENVKLAGFGSFVLREKRARIGRNPRTKEEAIISPRKTVSFRASQILKKIVKEK
jgi:integration host factor subunit alpha